MNAPLLYFGERPIGGDHPAYVIAEIGVNHNGNLELAHKLIDLAASSGADAVKFQTYVTEARVLPQARKAERCVCVTCLYVSLCVCVYVFMFSSFDMFVCVYMRVFICLYLRFLFI